jgi:hypothetical protein
LERDVKTRKELEKEYLRTPKEIGVYRIRITLNNRSYIAASIDIKARFNRHRLSLKTNRAVAMWFSKNRRRGKH